MTCTNSISCTTCKDIRVNSNGGNAYCVCPVLRYYDDGASPICRPCAYMCYTCVGLSTNCTSCSTSAHRVLSSTGTNTNTCLC